jgi:hypothetical protein
VISCCIKCLFFGLYLFRAHLHEQHLERRLVGVGRHINCGAAGESVTKSEAGINGNNANDKDTSYNNKYAIIAIRATAAAVECPYLSNFFFEKFDI